MSGEVITGLDGPPQNRHLYTNVELIYFIMVLVQSILSINQ